MIQLLDTKRISEVCSVYDAMTLSIMTLSVVAFSITILSLMGLVALTALVSSVVMLGEAFFIVVLQVFLLSDVMLGAFLLR